MSDNGNQNVQQLCFDFFQDQEAEQEQIQFASEDDAMDAIINPQENMEDVDTSWPPPDPDDAPGAVPPPPVPSAEEPVEEPGKPPKPLTMRNLRQLAVGFLASKSPDALATDIHGLFPRAALDTGAFFLSGREVSRTILVLTAENPEQCLMPRARRERAEAELAEQLAKKEELEAKIRETEPHLNASLFIETAVWEYEKTRMTKYHRCLRKIEKLRHDLQFSGKLERIIAEKTADENYIIFPEGTDLNDAIPQEWGILIAKPDYTLTLVREAVSLDSGAANRSAFALCTATAAAKDVRFTNGISKAQNGTIRYSNLPRRRPAIR